MARKIRNFFLGILAFVATVLVMAILAVLLVFYRPELLVNTANVRWALTKFMPELQLQFDTLELKARSDSFWRKGFELTTQNLCVDLQEPHVIHFCASKIHVKAVLDFEGFKLRLVGTPMVHLEGGTLDLILKPGPPTANSDPLAKLAEPSFEAIFGGYRDMVPHRVWGDLSVEFTQLDLRFSDSFRLRGKAALANGERPELLNFESVLELDLSFLEKALRLQIAAQGNLQESFLKAQVRAPEFQDLKIDATLARQLDLDIKAHIRGRTARISVDSQIQADARQIRMQSGARVELERPPFLKSRNIRLPQIQLLQKGTINYELTEKSYDFDAETIVESPSFSGIEVKVAAAAAYSYRRGATWQKSLKPQKFDAKARIPNLQTWAKEIRWTRLQIPAPFYRMQGPAALTLQGKDLNPAGGMIKAQFTTDFQDGLQAIKMDLPGEITWTEIFGANREVKLRGELAIQKLILELPRLSILGLPRFTLDSRIQQPDQVAPEPRMAVSRPVVPAKEGPLKWSVDLRIFTPGDPLTLRSNLISDPVPLKLDQKIWFSSSGGPQVRGSVSVMPMKVELFRRKIQVEKIVVVRQSPTVTALNGLFSYETSEVKVRIRLLGTSEAPQIVWESDPPLTQRQIISIIVFGKSLNELSQEETSSAQNLERAFADGALGVASLFLLASTPIESVSYDPVSKTYAARLKVDGKTSLSLGSDFEEKQSLALRRQLGGAWSIKTELQSTTEQKDHLSTFLEWFKRF